ncbi:methyltransferase domain-containing protein [Amycolatopsis sp. 195334CR]|uniref:class I SAM-dependent methyltransferase n=1 Tax=Amycolatopsis sp. 195334CR TaxID=2814588 RepID=UPI001A8F288A|nr:methyltransferase domain-containing protein [Amycolatopsis sp. 195334CR]MBN6041377.1 methyltransferase domain-containing protein [Amycolatopsis sp. 195334CR]
MFTGSYRYPDAGDHVTASFISHHEPYPGYWAASERLALDRLVERLDAGPRERVRGLDAGCGDGRLLPWLSHQAATITAIDPDPERLAAARGKHEALAPGTEITYTVGDTSTAGGGPYDLLLSNHVIQHVPTGAVGGILRDLAGLAAPGGALVLCYSRSPVGRGGYTVDLLVDGESRSEAVGRARFDELVAGPGEPGTLPVRLLDPAEVRAEAAEAGWVLDWEWTYHVLDDLSGLDAHSDRDEFVNESPLLAREVGRDMVNLFRLGSR